MKNFKLYSLLLFILTIFSACDDFDASLDTEYSANPTPEDVASEATALSAFQSWFVPTNSWFGPGLMLTTMSDMRTCSWGNQGMRDMSSEPRDAWDNNPGYSEASASESFYTAMYTLLANQSTLLTAMNDGNIDSSKKIECLARFGQAVAIGYIAMVYDRVWIVDETGPLFNGEATTPELAMEVALEKLDIAIDLANNNTFTIDAVNGVSLSSSEWSEFLNSMGARMLANVPRNSTQRDALDWDKVLKYANNGLTYDLEVLWTGFESNWWSEWLYYANASGWVRVDMRVINLLDPATPARWPSADGLLPPATSADARLDSDFEYLDSQDFDPSRGTYHFSNYRHSRYDYEIFDTEQTGSVPEMLKAENDLYKAEAILRSGGAISDAVTVINNSSRVLRGNLDPLSPNSTFEEVANAIHYERSIELLTSGMGLGFFEMRKNDLLQTGTPLHLPVPGAFLLAGGFESYTFGGVNKADGIDVSNGGW